MVRLNQSAPRVTFMDNFPEQILAPDEANRRAWQKIKELGLDEQRAAWLQEQMNPKKRFYAPGRAEDKI